MLNALGRFFKGGASGEENDPMAFLDEYAAVMNRHTGLKVYNGFRRGHTACRSMRGSDRECSCGWRTGNTASMRKSEGR